MEAMVRKAANKTRTVAEEGTLRLYLQELRRIPLLSREEEQAYARLAAQGNEEARQRLIQANLRFVVSVAKRYRNRGVPLEDLISEGNIGLLYAVRRFDPARGVHFISYAIWWIRQAILKAVHDNSLIRVPLSRAGELARIEQLLHDGAVTGGAEPCLAEIAEELAVDESDLRDLLHAGRTTLSLDSPVGDPDDSGTLGASLEDRTVPRPEEVMVGVSLREELDSVLAELSDREAGILRDRFGFTEDRGMSLLEVSQKYGLSRERIRQIEKRALRKMRASESVAHLKVYAA